MKAQLSGHGVEITEALRAKTDKKLENLTPFEDIINSIHIVFNVEKSTHAVEGIVNIRGNSIHAKSEGDEMYKAIDEMVDKLFRQLQKHKEKLKSHR